MAQKSETDGTESSKPDNPKSDTSRSAASSRTQQPAAASSSGSSGPGAGGRGDGGPGPRGARVTGQKRGQYLIAPRRLSGVAPLGVTPLSMNAVEEALRAAPDIEVVDTLGPKSVVGALADGLAGSPRIIVARMDHSKAEVLHQQAQGQLIVERDQPLTLLDVPMAPPLVTASIGGAPALPIQIVVLGKDEAPVEDAEVYLYGSLLPAMAVTNSAGQATVSLFGDTPQSIRAIYVKPKGDYWTFYQNQPAIDPSQPNIIALRPLSEQYPNFPGQQVMGWGQKAMRLDQFTQDRAGQGVKVAIIDSGAATTHEDLRNITKGVDVLGKSTQTNNWMVDTLAHGSHCAGIVAGSSANKVGIMGFAPAAEIHVCKIFPGGQISQLIDALEYCIDQQIDIVNLSLGTDQVSEALEQVLARVVSLGIAVIAAAGNSGGQVQYPASSPNVLAVAAIGKMGEFPSDSYHAQTVQQVSPDQKVSPEGYFSPGFTCFGRKIALCAPGVAVLSSVPENSFAAWDGTSMAAPHVTGVAALVLAHHPDFAGPFRARNFQRVSRLFDILRLSARPIDVGSPERTGFGIPDVPAALGLQLGPQLGGQLGGHLGTQALPPQAHLGSLGQPPGAAMGSLFGSQFAGNPFAGLGQPSYFRPAGVDPVTAMYAPLQSGAGLYALAPWLFLNPATLAASHRTPWSGQGGYWVS